MTFEMRSQICKVESEDWWGSAEQAIKVGLFTEIVIWNVRSTYTLYLVVSIPIGRPPTPVQLIKQLPTSQSSARSLKCTLIFGIHQNCLPTHCSTLPFFLINTNYRLRIQEFSIYLRSCYWRFDFWSLITIPWTIWWPFREGKLVHMKWGPRHRG